MNFDTDHKQARAWNITVCVIFLVSLGVGLWRALPWLDWGAQADFAACAAGLYTGPESGSPVIALAARLATLMPGGDFAFALNVFAAFVFALCAAALFFLGRGLAGSDWAGAAVWVVFMLIPDWRGMFDAAGHRPFVTLAAFLALGAAARAMRGAASVRSLLLALFVCAVAAPLNIFLFAVFIVVAAMLYSRAVRVAAQPVLPAAAAMLVVAAGTPLALLPLRERLSLATGPAWAEGLSRSLNMPEVSRFGEVFGDPAALYPFYRSLADLFLRVPGAPYFPMLLAAVVGFILCRDARRPRARFLIILTALAPALFLLSLSGAPALFHYLLLCHLALLFVMGAAEIAAQMRGSNISAVRALRTVWLAAAAGIVLFAAAPRGGAALAPRHSRARPFAAAFLGSLQRDALVFINPREDSLLVVQAAPALLGARRDVITIRPDLFPDPAYRTLLRASYGNDIKIPTEKQFQKLREEIVSLNRSPDGSPAAGAANKKRLEYSIMMIAQRGLAEENMRAHGVYFNTIQDFVRNKNLFWTCFTPERAAFKMCPIGFDFCVRDSMRSSKAFNAKLERRVSEIATDPDIIAALRNDPKISDAEREHFGDSVRLHITNTFADLMAAAAQACDTGPTGFGTACVRTQLKNAMRDTSDDPLTPFPEIATDCFVLQFHLPFILVKNRLDTAIRSPLRRDPVAARQLSQYLSDLAEYGYIHNNREFSYMIFSEAAKLSPENARAQFFLLLIYEQTANYDKAGKQAGLLDTLLRNRERTGRLDDYYIYMLSDLYNKLGRPADAERYRKLIEGE